MTYAGHEQAEYSTQAEAHCSRDAGFDGTRLHGRVHLLFVSVCGDLQTERTYCFDHGLLLIVHALQVAAGCGGHAPDRRSHPWEGHGRVEFGSSTGLSVYLKLRG